MITAIRPREDELPSDFTYREYVSSVQAFLDALAQATDAKGLRVNIQAKHLTPLVPEIVELVLKRRAEGEK